MGPSGSGRRRGMGGKTGAVGSGWKVCSGYGPGLAYGEGGGAGVAHERMCCPGGAWPICDVPGLSGPVEFVSVSRGVHGKTGGHGAGGVGGIKLTYQLAEEAR